MSLVKRAAANAEGMERWRRFRAKGRLHFVLVWGVLFWGGLMFLIMGLGMSAAKFGVDGITARLVAFNVFAWISGGVLFGMLTWHLSEKAFHLYETNRSRATP